MAKCEQLKEYYYVNSDHEFIGFIFALSGKGADKIASAQKRYADAIRQDPPEKLNQVQINAKKKARAKANGIEYIEIKAYSKDKDRVKSYCADVFAVTKHNIESGK